VSALNKLVSHFDDYVALDGKEKNELSQRVKERKIKRKQFILQENDICRHYSFIAEGCFKMYGIDKSGKEHNLQFAAENDWIADLGSFYSEKPSKLYIEALEPAVIIQLEKKDLIFFYVNYPKFDRNFRVMIENKFIELQNRVLQNISSTAEERYLAFLEQYPSLSNRLPGTQIASYLGVTPEFLSKIRRDVTSR